MMPPHASRTQTLQGAWRFGRYSAVGGATFAFDLGLLYVATSLLHIPYYISTPVSFLIAVSLNFFISRVLVFRGSARKLHRGYAYFIGVAVLGALLTTLLVSVGVQFLFLPYLIARTATACVVGIGNYLFNLFVNFRVAGNHL